MSSIKKQQFQRGFTLIELMIVMVIIGILSALAIGSYQSSQQKSRDAQRKSNLQQITNALEVYYNDKGVYPTSSGGSIVGCNGSVCDWGDEFSDANGTVYMVAIPTDPSNGFQYFYDSSDGSDYQLYARLENVYDQDVNKDIDDDPQVYSGTNCGADTCNYGVASSNAKPTDGKTLIDD